jgi:hypothetical protein
MPLHLQRSWYALATDLPLEPREGILRVSRPHAGGRVERLGNRDERHGVLVEQLDQLGEVRERTSEPVDLVDHHGVDLVRSNVG